MNTIHKAARLAGLLALGLGAGSVQAATTVCASNAAGLNNALVTLAANSPTPMTIRIEQGAYALGAMAMRAQSPIAIEGGYQPGTNCTQRAVDPANTVLDFGGGFVQFWQEQGSPRASLVVDGLTLRHGRQLSLWAGTPDIGDITLRRVRVTDFVGNSAAETTMPVTMYATRGNLVVENVLFDALTQIPTNHCAIDVQMSGDAYANLRFVTAALQGGDDLCVRALEPSGARKVDIVDSLIWKVWPNANPSQLYGAHDSGGGSLDVNVINSGFSDLDPNRWGTWVVTNPIYNAPNWVDALNGDFHLKPPTTSIDAGTTQIPHGSVPPTDIEGNPRPYAGSLPDPGAYEYQVPSVPSTVVVNNNDSGAGSLRQAVHNANLNGGGNITFAIPGPCPRLIALASPLEPITTAVTIDATTQPGSTTNTSPTAFDANLCVALVPANIGMANALKVASDAPDAASLTVRGLFFGAFNQPLMLLGGNDHRIVGNQFGGTIGGAAIPGATLNAISIGANASGSLIVGGDNPADRNVIGGANNPVGAGISVQGSISGCQIVNNLVGLDADGLTARPNTTGINLNGSGCELRGNRIAYSYHDGIWVQGDNNMLVRNVIGRDANGQAAQNGGLYGESFIGWGIRVSGSGNTIGLGNGYAYDGQYHANDVRYNAQGGIGITDGSGNVVRGNVVTDNGIVHDGQAMDIDLGGDGITPNFMPNPGTGPNGLQNHPQITGIAYGSAPNLGQANVTATIGGILHAAPGQYRVDVYFAQSSCEVDGRGHAENYIANTTVVIGPGATAQTFAAPAVLPVYFPPASLVANATDSAGNSSELGPCVVQDTIFADGMDD